MRLAQLHGDILSRCCRSLWSPPMIAPLPNRNPDLNATHARETAACQTLVVMHEEDAAAVRRTAFQLALASHDGHVRLSRTEDFPELASYAEAVAEERRWQCRTLANMTFRDGANIGALRNEAREARTTWVRATQALLSGDIQTFQGLVMFAESLLEDLLLQLALGGAGNDEAGQLCLDMSLAVHDQRLRWNDYCRELAERTAFRSDPTA